MPSLSQSRQSLVNITSDIIKLTVHDHFFNLQASIKTSVKSKVDKSVVKVTDTLPNQVKTKKMPKSKLERVAEVSVTSIKCASNITSDTDTIVKNSDSNTKSLSVPVKKPITTVKPTKIVNKTATNEKRIVHKDSNSTTLSSNSTLGLKSTLSELAGDEVLVPNKKSVKKPLIMSKRKSSVTNKQLNSPLGLLSVTSETKGLKRINKTAA